MPEIIISELIRSSRSSISLVINDSGKLVVKAPRFIPMFLIRRFVDQKKDWILKHLQNRVNYKKKKKQYIEGEEFFYLGKGYKLHSGNYEQIVFSHTGRLNFPQFLYFRIQKEISNYYLKEAKAIISKRAEYHSTRMNLKFGTITFSDTKSKWGTCTHNNNLQFNWRLIMAPLEVIDYVVIHELVHINEKNHSRRFWNTVSVSTPAYKQHRKWLHTNSHKLTI